MRAYRDLFAITGVALALRLLAWRVQGAGSFEELLALHLLSRPLFESFGLLIRGGQEPLYQFALWIWSGFLGESLFAARLLSVLAGTAASAAVWLTAREVTGRREANIAALLTAVAPAFVVVSVQARPFSSVALLVSFSVWAYMRAGRSGCTHRTLVPWCGLAGAAMLADSAAVLPIAVLAGWVALKARGQARRRFLVATLIAAAPFMLWSAATLPAGLSRWFAKIQLGLGKAVSNLILMPGGLIAPQQEPLLALLASAAVIGLVLLALRPASDSQPNGAMKLLTLSAAITLAAIAFTGAGAGDSLSVVLPILAVLLAVGLVKVSALVPLTRRRQAVFVAAGVLALFMVPPSLDAVSSRRVLWNEAARFIQNRERYGDMIFAEWFSSELPIRNSYRGALPIRSGYAQDAALSFSERLVKYAGAFEPSELMLARMESDIAFAQRIFLVTGAVKPNENRVQGWFLGNGWSMEEVWTKKGFGVSVILFRRDGGSADGNAETPPKEVDIGQGNR